MNLRNILILAGVFLVIGGAVVLAEETTPSGLAETTNSAAAAPEDKQKVALAKEILNLMCQNAVFDMTTSLLEKQILPDIRRDNPDQADKIDDAVIASEMKAFVSYQDQLNAKDAVTYANAFSLDDLQAQVAFYKSSAGTYFIAHLTDPKTQVPKENTTQIKNFYKSPVGKRITKAKFQPAGPDEDAVIQIEQLTPHILASEIQKAGLKVPKEMEP